LLATDDDVGQTFYSIPNGQKVNCTQKIPTEVTMYEFENK